MHKDNKLFTVSYPPYIHSQNSILKVMRDVSIALAFPAAAACYFFELYAVELILLSVVSCVLFEYLWQKIVSKKVLIWDLSSVVTGLIFALTLPPQLPWWIVLTGTFTAIIIGKQIFGGLGKNPLNPALLGRVTIELFWPGQLNQWLNPFSFSAGYKPLQILKEGLPNDIPSVIDLILGARPGCIGTTSVIAIVFGGLYLAYRKHINLIIPFTYISIVAIGTFLFKNDVAAGILGSTVMFGAFFIATDPVTTPVSYSGKFVFAFFCGVITILLRRYLNVADGVFVSILAMNAVVPLIDKVLIKKPFGNKYAKY